MNLAFQVILQSQYLRFLLCASTEMLIDEVISNEGVKFHAWDYYVLIF